MGGIGSFIGKKVAKKVVKKVAKKVAPKKKVVETKPKKKTTNNQSMWVKVPNKYFKDEEKYEAMIDSGKKLSDAQLKAYSKAIKFTTDELAYIDDRAYVTRKARDNISGTVKHALESMDYFGAPKKYLSLYKSK
jgi:vancomycin resistance protein YoaR